MAEELKTGEAAVPAEKPAAGKLAKEGGAVKSGAAKPGGAGAGKPAREGGAARASAPKTEKAGKAAEGKGRAAEGKGGAAKPAKEGGAKAAEAKPAKGQSPPGTAAGGGEARQGAKPAKEGGGRQAPKLPVKEPRLRVLYREKVAKALRDEFGYSSVQQVPRLEKIVVSMGVGEAIANKKLLEAAVKELAQITGLRPVKTKAKKSIANFKVRKGMEIGAMVTLRGYHMYEFFDRLTNVALPRVKDFRGTNPNAFDGRGNYALGLAEQIIFPEIDYDKIERVSGMNIAICTTARTDLEARQLLAGLGMPFRK
jgi:large subunit ribosomal protein L5